MILAHVGVDEAGRGPLAGPVAVGAALVPADFDWSLLPGVGDSKQLSEKKRIAVYERAQELQAAGVLQVAVVMASAQEIDAVGIVPAIRQSLGEALQEVLTRSGLPLVSEQVLVKLDGGLKAPAAYLYQETIIKGDQKEQVIGLASIAAKVTRDRYMEALATRQVFAVYDFARHKGYGTKAHRNAVVQNGLSAEHRVSFCKNIKLL